MTVGEALKTGAKGVTIMFVRYDKQESDSLRTGDQNTISDVMWDAIWLKHMHYQPIEAVGMLELEDLLEV